MSVYSGRNTEFGYGASGSEASPIGIEHTSVLMPYMRSPNGMSGKDAARQTPMGQLPSPNGYAPSTYGADYPSLSTSVVN